MAENGPQTDLIAQAVAGDRPALERLLLDHYDRLIRLVGRKLPANLRGVVAEEDVLQETYIEVARRIDSFEPRGARAFYRWLVTIAEHRLHDIIRGQAAAKRGGGRANLQQAARTPDESWNDLIELLAGPQHTPSRSAARHEAAAAVHIGLASLKGDCRSAIRMRYIEGLSVAETAEALGRTERAVHSLCYRGLKELRASLGRASKYLTRR